jgi:hypothetical protein
MTKVEELRDKIYTKAAAHIGILESEFSCSPDENRTYEELTRELATDLYALISAARAEGVAEGEEGMKKWIRNTQDFIAQGDEVSCTDVHYATCVDNTEQDFAEAQVDLYIVPASLLAPKEKP